MRAADVFAKDRLRGEGEIYPDLIGSAPRRFNRAGIILDLDVPHEISDFKRANHRRDERVDRPYGVPPLLAREPCPRHSKKRHRRQHSLADHRREMCNDFGDLAHAVEVAAKDGLPRSWTGVNKLNGVAIRDEPGLRHAHHRLGKFLEGGKSFALQDGARGENGRMDAHVIMLRRPRVFFVLPSNPPHSGAADRSRWFAGQV